MTSPQLDSFQTALLSDLRQHVATRAEPTTSAPTSLGEAPSVRRSRLKVAAWVGGLAAACTAAAVVVPTMGAQPAYAVTAEPAGVVHVQIHRLEDAPALQADLERRGIHADIRYLPADTGCAPNRYASMPSAGHSASTFTVGSSSVDLKIDRRDVPAGATVVISASRMREQDGINAEVGIAKGKVAGCTITHLR